MGCDIHGYIEVAEEFTGKENKKYLDWSALVDLGVLLNRSYDSFGCLFGVRNMANFKPIAEDRGLPEDISYTIKHELEDAQGYHSHSYITLKEIKEIDMSEEAETYDSRPHELLFDKKGKLEFQSKAGMSSELERNGVYQILEEYPEASVTIENEDGSLHVISNAKMTRGDALKGSFERCIKLMKFLDKWYDGVRMVVWFDN